MSVNYVSDSSGETIAVQIPISDWKKIKRKYPDIDDLDDTLPAWQKELMDTRLTAIVEDPSSILDIKGLYDELDRDVI
ncbi:MAG: addiction module component CHP02574 family protein [Chitinophagia bacterium]|nr:addiction module component CHP02574 family protein [Chitinophagia bacterium]